MPGIARLRITVEFYYGRLSKQTNISVTGINNSHSNNIINVKIKSRHILTEG